MWQNIALMAKTVKLDMITIISVSNYNFNRLPTCKCQNFSSRSAKFIFMRERAYIRHKSTTTGFNTANVIITSIIF